MLGRTLNVDHRLYTTYITEKARCTKFIKMRKQGAPVYHWVVKIASKVHHWVIKMSSEGVL